MPELPEVETVKRTLSEFIIGRSIMVLTVHKASVIKIPEAEEFASLVTGRTFDSVERRGKYLLLNLSGGYLMVVHLRMTGRLVYIKAEEPVKKHTHVIFHLDNGYELRFTDQRRFGCIWVVAKEERAKISGLCSLGPEPLGVEFTRVLLGEALRGRQTKIKAFLLNQKMIAGIGNIYADEILFASGIHPERRAGSLNEEEIDRLYTAIRDILSTAVQHRGTSFSDYVDGRGEKGSHQFHLRVYQQAGKDCPRCGSKIIRTKVGSRSSYHCPECQK